MPPSLSRTPNRLIANGLEVNENKSLLIHTMLYYQYFKFRQITERVINMKIVLTLLLVIPLLFACGGDEHAGDTADSKEHAGEAADEKEHAGEAAESK